MWYKICREMCSENFENRLQILCEKNILNRDFSIVRKHGMGPENFKCLKILSKLLETYIKCYKRLTWGKTFESSQHFCWNSKFVIMDYLPSLDKIALA